MMPIPHYRQLEVAADASRAPVTENIRALRLRIQEGEQQLVRLWGTLFSAIRLGESTPTFRPPPQASRFRHRRSTPRDSKAAKSSADSGLATETLCWV